MIILVLRLVHTRILLGGGIIIVISGCNDMTILTTTTCRTQYTHRQGKYRSSCHFGLILAMEFVIPNGTRTTAAFLFLFFSWMHNVVIGDVNVSWLRHGYKSLGNDSFLLLLLSRRRMMLSTHRRGVGIDAHRWIVLSTARRHPRHLRRRYLLSLVS